MDPVTLDGVDRGLLHALRIDGRVPFSRIADVLGVSENTVARRYRRLRAAGVLRVVGVLNGPLLGRTSWTVRVRCTPDAATPIANALAKRPDTHWVHILSGGTEISCNVQTRSDDERDALLMDKLPRTALVLDVSAHALLGGGTIPGEWHGFDFLTSEQVTQLTPEPAEPGEIQETDDALIAALARDGRASYADLAKATGWSDSTVKRRLTQLRGVLVYQVNVPYAVLGYRAEARLWLTVRPAALRRIAETLAGHPETVFAAVTTGRTNLVASVACRDSAHLYRYVTERVGDLEDVHTLETAPVIRTVKYS